MLQLSLFNHHFLLPIFRRLELLVGLLRLLSTLLVLSDQLLLYFFRHQLLLVVLLLLMVLDQSLEHLRLLQDLLDFLLG